MSRKLRTRTHLLAPLAASVLSVSVALPALPAAAAGPATGPVVAVPRAVPPLTEDPALSDPADEGAGDAGAGDGGAGAAPEPVEAEVEQHSSNEREPTVTARATGTSDYFTLHERTRPVAPGLDHTRFDRYDARGWVRVNVLTADLSTPGLRLDYASPGKVSSTAPLTSALQRDRAVAGVNADFFDIGNTGAPLGTGVDRQRGLLHASRGGPTNQSFTLNGQNAAAIARTFLRASITRPNKPSLDVTNLNAPRVNANGIGIYTPAWGSTSRTRTAPAGTARREVTVIGGRVRANRMVPTSGQIDKGTVLLVGRGTGARQLSRLRRGNRVGVTYALNRAGTRVAVGGNVRLLRDGRVLAVNDEELHPRTAIGIDRDEGKVIIITADGRQSHSRGLTMVETARMMQRLGAEDALNLDGGGSSTMVARESGEASGVVNSPSDGRLRSVPNGLGFAVAQGSGQLRGIRIEPAADMLDSNRVLSGLSRRLVARGHDESHDPVAARPTWSGADGVSTTPGPNNRTWVTGRRTGTGTVTATRGSASGQYKIRVLGAVHRLETTVPSVALAGRSGSQAFEVRGYDARGFGTWVEPRDIRLAYDRNKLSVRRIGRGFSVKALRASTSDVIRVTAGGRSTHIGVTVGLARGVVDRMNGPSGWSASSYPVRADARITAAPDRRGRQRGAIAMRYSLLGGTKVRAAYLDAAPPRELPTPARRIGLWVRGDGKGPWLRAELRDKSGATATVNLSQRVTWRGWRFVSTEVPQVLVQPLTLARIYAVEDVKSRKYSGVLAFDDLTVMTERTAPVPVTAPLKDPFVAEHEPAGPGPVEVAVVSGGRVFAARPNSLASNRTRRALREVVAAAPDLVLLNGDMVRAGTANNLGLLQRIIEEELQGKVAWQYVPGDSELAPRGGLGPFRARFGDPVKVVNQAGTRFVLLNTAQGSLRLGGFSQLSMLSNQLDAAASDPGVTSVVVVAHHPTNDPVAGGTAEIIDPREGELVDDLVTGFRGTSEKPVAYVAAQGRRFGLTRHDDVVQLAVGPVLSPLRGGTGAFAGLTRFRVAPAAEQWLRAEMRPAVDSLRVLAPARLARGAVADAGAQLGQLGRRQPVSYPMNAVWVPSPTTHIGPPGGASPTAMVAYEPATGRLTGLRPGQTDLTVEVNGRSASTTVTVD